MIALPVIEGMKMVLAHRRGKIELEQVWPKPADVKAIGEVAKLSKPNSRGPMASARALSGLAAPRERTGWCKYCLAWEISSLSL
jgi:hypothetical protein